MIVRTSRFPLRPPPSAAGGCDPPAPLATTDSHGDLAFLPLGLRPHCMHLSNIYSAKVCQALALPWPWAAGLEGVGQLGDAAHHLPASGTLCTNSGGFLGPCPGSAFSEKDSR